MRRVLAALCLHLVMAGCVAQAANATAATLAATAAAAIASPTIGQRTFPALTPAGTRAAESPAVQVCTCIDVGLNDPLCFKGITNYCETTDPPANMTVCEAMSGFYNFQNLTAAKVAARFFIDTCAVALPPNPSACACLDVSPPREKQEGKGVLVVE